MKLLGISPSGFNATGESDIRNYYDHVLSQQEKVLRPPLQRVLEALQVSLFGKVDKSLGFSFASLSETDENAKVLTQQAKINNLCAVLDRDIVSAEEVRQMLVSDPDSGFDGLDPELPEDAEGDDLLLAGPAIPGEEPAREEEEKLPPPPRKASPTVSNPALR